MIDSVFVAIAVTKAVPFFRVADIQRSVRYYVDGLGFEFQHRWDPDGRLQWCMLRLGDASLMLQEMRPEQARELQGSLGKGVSVCFMCSDTIGLYRRFIERGIEATRPFVGNGLWATTLTDPDGYIIEFESPTDEPEETEYDEHASP